MDDNISEEQRVINLISGELLSGRSVEDVIKELVGNGIPREHAETVVVAVSHFLKEMTEKESPKEK